MRGPRLRVVGINDVYSLENLPRLASLVRHHAQEAPADHMLVTLAGDFVAPSLLGSLDFGRGMVDCLNAVGVTHAILGNHEDDLATSELRARIDELRATWIGTNVRGLHPRLRERVTLLVSAPGGRTVTVGLVGVVMDDPAVYRRIPFGGWIEPANPAALRAAERLLGEGCAVVLALTHQSLASDGELARAWPGAPLILGGHEHQVVLEPIAGGWILKAGAEAAHALVVDLEWPADAPVAGPDRPVVTARLEEVALYPEDAAVRARVDGHMLKVRGLQAATLVVLGPGESLSSIGTRVRQTSIGALLCSRLRDALGADGCLINGGGIRGARVYTTHLTYGDLETELPFDNEAVVVSLPGQVVRDAVAASRRLAPVESGGFLQVDDGMAVDPVSRGVLAVGGAPLELDRLYRIAIMRGLLLGLDGVEPLVSYARAHPELVPPAGSGRETKVILVETFARSLWQSLGGFAEVDRDGDGRVTGSEVAAALSRVTGEPPSEIAANLVVRALDADGDATISPDDGDGPIRR